MNTEAKTAIPTNLRISAGKSVSWKRSTIPISVASERRSFPRKEAMISVRFLLFLSNLFLGLVVNRSLTRLCLVDLVLEYVEGGDLLDYILAHNGLSEPMAQHITRQMCSALSVRLVWSSNPYVFPRTLTSCSQYVHSKDITHRDLKPEVCRFKSSSHRTRLTPIVLRRTCF
jgi:serine/threonine protein kinase